MADMVMRMPEPRLQRQMAPEEEEEELLQAKPLVVQSQGGLEGEEEELLQTKPLLRKQVDNGIGTPSTTPTLVHDVLRSPGRPLDPATRVLMEPRFGHDFSQVRVHTNAKAAEAARAVNARAFTVGRDVVFGTGQQTSSSEGRRLLAHELTHILQQQGAAYGLRLNREPVQGAGGGGGIQEQCLAKLGEVANKPGPQSRYVKSGCPSNFCQPFADRAEATADLADVRTCLLGGILVKLSEGSKGGLLGGPGSKVVKYWGMYLDGGVAPQDLSAERGQDFTDSLTTADTTRFLMGELRKDIETHHAAGLPLSEYSLPRVLAAKGAIDTPGDQHEMNFNIPNDVAGNLAGGVGKDQRANPIGATPSPWDDLREVRVDANLQPKPDGSVTVTPQMTFTVQDTIDLCPGNCGSLDEQVATIPLSRFEATGLTGDVPITVRFSAPPDTLTPFDVGGGSMPTP